MKWTNKEARQEARRYAATLLEAQDSPDWCIDVGLPEDKEIIFMNELLRLAARIRKTINEE